MSYEKSKQMKHINLRLPEDVVEFFIDQYPQYTSAMRDVLVRFARRKKQ